MCCDGTVLRGEREEEHQRDQCVQVITLLVSIVRLENTRYNISPRPRPQYCICTRVSCNRTRVSYSHILVIM